MLFSCNYNIFQVRETVLEVEYPLVVVQLEAIDEQLKKAETDLNWNSEGSSNTCAKFKYLSQSLSHDFHFKILLFKVYIEECLGVFMHLCN